MRYRAALIAVALAACSSAAKVASPPETVIVTVTVPVTVIVTVLVPASTTTTAAVPTTTLPATTTTESEGQVIADVTTSCPGLSLPKCGISITAENGGYSIHVDPAIPAGFTVLKQFGSVSKCFNDLDYDKMGQTRSVDGRVTSANGRTSWSYHPDQGLNLTCNVP